MYISVFDSGQSSDIFKSILAFDSNTRAFKKCVENFQPLS